MKTYYDFVRKWVNADILAIMRFVAICLSDFAYFTQSELWHFMLNPYDIWRMVVLIGNWSDGLPLPIRYLKIKRARY